MRWEPSPWLRLGLGAWCFLLRAQPPRRAGSGAGRLSGEACRLPSPRAPARLCPRTGRGRLAPPRAEPPPPALATARVWSSAAAELGARSRPAARKGRQRPRRPRPQAAAAAAAPTSQSQLCFPDLLAAAGPHAWEGSVCGCPCVCVCAWLCVCTEAGRARGGRGPSRQGKAWLAGLRLHLAGKPGAARPPLLGRPPFSFLGRIYILGVVEFLQSATPSSAWVARAQAPTPAPPAPG